MVTEARLAAALLLATVAVGCASSHGTATHSVDPEIAGAAESIIDELFPGSCRMVHKLNLRAGSRESVLTGHMVLKRGSEIQALAVDEFGGPVFTFSVTPTGRSVDLAPEKLRRDILLRGPVRDLELIFLPPPSPPVAASAENGVAQVRWNRGDASFECDFDLAHRRMLGCTEWNGRRRSRELSYEYVPEDRPGAGSLAYVTVDNHILHYSMDIEVLQIVPQ